MCNNKFKLFNIMRLVLVENSIFKNVSSCTYKINSDSNKIASGRCNQQVQYISYETHQL